jgi:hypothetical protein
LQLFFLTPESNGSVIIADVKLKQKLFLTPLDPVLTPASALPPFSKVLDRRNHLFILVKPREQTW